MKKKGDIWERKAASEDYAAAEKYLSLLFSKDEVRDLVGALRAAPAIEYEAKDILRASQTHLLETKNAMSQKISRRSKREKSSRPSCWCVEMEKTA